MRKMFMVLFLLLCTFSGLARAQSDAPFSSLEEFQSALDTVLNAAEADRVEQLDALWNRLLANQQVPMAFDDGTVVFLYRGEAETVEWRGDFNFWNEAPESFGEQQGDTDLWLMTDGFPPDARLDYKIVLDGSVWLLDPYNPFQQMGGFGPNSELRMPEYEPSPYVDYRDDIEHGTLTGLQTIASTNMGYAINYRVYRPSNYSELHDLPVIYATDGQEYADDAMGSMVIVLDNMIADGLIEPVMAVFIDPRDPNDRSVNRRESELITNPQYAAFIASELVPLIDVVYDTNPTPEARVMLGTSLGGLNAAYVGLHYSDVFGMLAINSPAFWVAPSIFQEYEDSERLPLNIFMTTGCPWDICEDARRMREIMELQGYPLRFIQVHEGHSWGNWRALLDDMLLYFFAHA
ncbi:MAG: alpha/beta hydrolase-fold protein [Anaerolineae bacterium]